MLILDACLVGGFFIVGFVVSWFLHLIWSGLGLRLGVLGFEFEWLVVVYMRFIVYGIGLVVFVWWV